MRLNRRSFIAASALLAQAAAPTARGKTLPTLTMQAAWVNDAEFMGYFVAQSNGYYEAEGLDFKYRSGGPDVIPEAALLSARADVALSTVETAIKAITDQQAPLVIIGAQYQKSPVGIVSLASRPLRSPADLVGKTIAVPPVNRLTMDAFLKLNGIDKRSVRVVPYAYDPTPLLKGEIDGSLDFTTNVPFTIQRMGQQATGFLLADFKLPLFNDVVIVTRDTLRARRAELAGFLRASRRGWVDNFKDPSAYPPRFASTWFKGTGRSIDNEIYFNKAQRPLIETPRGIYSISPDAIANCVSALNAVGVRARDAHFDTSVLNER